MKGQKKISFFRVGRLMLLAAFFLAAIFVFLKLFTGGIWSGDGRFNIIIDADPLVLFSIAPNSHQAAFLTIPGDVMLEVPYGYKTYPASAIYALGNLDKKRGGGLLLSKAVENTFGVAIEGYLASRNQKKIDLSEVSKNLDEFKKNYFSWHGLIPAIVKFQKETGNIDTNLSISDLAHLWNSVRALRFDEITVIDMSQSPAVDEVKLPDGTVAGYINQEMLDPLLAANFQDKMIRLQNISVEVINATGQEKIASQFARILQSLGANVVVKSTAESTRDSNCRIYLSRPDLKSSVLVEKLKKLYDCKLQEANSKDVSDIKIVLGKDFIK